MSNLDEEYNSILEEIKSKLQEAQDIIKSVQTLARDNNVELYKYQFDGVLDAVYDLPIVDIEPPDNVGAWSSSLGYTCW